MKSFYAVRKLNEKNRIIIPDCIERNTKINFYHIYKDYLSLYSEEDFYEKLDYLYALKEKMMINGTDPTKIDRLLFNLETDILGYSYVQTQNRLVIPKNIVEAFKLNKIVLVGCKDHIKLFPNEESYYEFKEKVKLK